MKHEWPTQVSAVRTRDPNTKIDDIFNEIESIRNFKHK